MTPFIALTTNPKVTPLIHSPKMHSSTQNSTQLSSDFCTRLADFGKLSISRLLRRLQTTLGGIVFKDSRSATNHSVGGEPLNQTDVDAKKC